MAEQIEKKYTNEMLKEMQSWDLDRKIATSLTRIAEFANHFNNQVYVSFSGGKDSTVLLDLVRKVVPDVPVVFSNTGLEYPEIQAFARSKGAEFVRPKMMFNEVITKYGYPIISKEVSEAIYYARRIVKVSAERERERERTPLRKRRELLGKQYNAQQLMLIGKYPKEGLTGLRKQLDKEIDCSDLNYKKIVESMGKKSMFNKTKWLPLCQMPFLISHYCCIVMKKSPMGIYGRQKKQYPYVGTMAEESLMRKQAWIRHGCNAFDSKKIISQPLSFWTEQDILAYIKRFNLDICSVYGEIETLSNGKLHCTGCQRTGCVFCGFGAHLEKDGNERFLRLKETHPKQYNYCIGGGQWSDNPYYDPELTTEPDEMGWVNWNPKKIWCPSPQGLGFGVVFDYLNAEYGDDFIRYK